MDAKSTELLEFPPIRERLAAATGVPPSRRLAEALEPSTDPVVVARWLDETDEARAFLSSGPTSASAARATSAPAIERAARGGRLEPRRAAGRADTLVAAAGSRDALRRASSPAAARAGARASSRCRTSAPGWS